MDQHSSSRWHRAKPFDEVLVQEIMTLGYFKLLPGDMGEGQLILEPTCLLTL
jgi:hypothetical protein